MTPIQSKTLSVIKDRERDKTRLSVVGEVADGRFALTNPLSLAGIHLYPVGGWNQMQPPGLKSALAHAANISAGAHPAASPKVPPSLSGVGAPVPSGGPTGPAPGAFPIRCTSSPDVLILRLVEQAG